MWGAGQRREENRGGGVMAVGRLNVVLRSQWLPLSNSAGLAHTILLAWSARRPICYQETDSTPAACLRT